MAAMTIFGACLASLRPPGRRPGLPSAGLVCRKAGMSSTAAAARSAGLPSWRRQRARSVVAALDLGNVELFAGDVHELGPAAVGGPFDLAYTRFFLMHQPDPVRTLTQIARLLRPGGLVVAQEALRSPPPRSHPHLDALGAYWDLVYQVLEQAGGVPHGAVDGLAGSARAAGLDVVAADGSFTTTRPELGFDLHAATLLAARERAIASGIAAAQQIDDLASDLRAAKGDGYEWVSTPFVLDLTLRKPAAA